MGWRVQIGSDCSFVYHCPELQDTDKQWNSLTQDVGDVVQEMPLDESAGGKSIGHG